MLRFLLLWLLVLALPVQGMAAVASTYDSRHGHEHRHAEAFTASVHDHGADHAMHEHAHALAVDGDADHASSHSGKHLSPSQCSVCAACCAAAAIPPSLMQLPAIGILSVAAVPAPESRFAGHIPDPLKRPPRPLSI